MEARRIYTKEDCVDASPGCSIKGRVIVMAKSEPLQEDGNQLFYCTGGNASGSRPIGSSISVVSLSDGGFYRGSRSDVVGILKPKLLPDSARLHLSQIRPSEALDLHSNQPKYSGYSFLPNGRYSSGVWLCSEKEVMDYVEMQKPYQYRIMICDRNDFCVLEMQEQALIYPTHEQLCSLGFSEPEQPEGMKMT